MVGTVSCIAWRHQLLLEPVKFPKHTRIKVRGGSALDRAQQGTLDPEVTMIDPDQMYLGVIFSRAKILYRDASIRPRKDCS